MLVVTKKLVVTEGIRIRRRKTMEEHSEPVMLRSQCVVVEREDGEGDGAGRL